MLIKRVIYPVSNTRSVPSQNKKESMTHQEHDKEDTPYKNYYIPGVHPIVDLRCSGAGVCVG